MSPTKPNRDVEPGHEVLDGLRALAGRIDGERYPGAAWPARRASRRQRLILWPAAAAAGLVAAAVALVVLRPQGAPVSVAPQAPAPVEIARILPPAQASTGWYVPADIDPTAGAGEIHMETPDIAGPSAVEFVALGGFEWHLTAGSFPTLEMN